MRLVDAVYVRIVDLAKERGWSLNALATFCGVPHSTIATMTRSSTVKLSTVYGICAGLDMSLEEFFHSPRFDKDIITD